MGIFKVIGGTMIAIAICICIMGIAGTFEGASYEASLGVSTLWMSFIGAPVALVGCVLEN